MKLISIVLFLFLPASLLAQHEFEITNASKFFDIKITVAGCENGFCRGRSRFAFFKKGLRRPYQTIDHENTLIQLDDDGLPPVNINLLYDTQSVVHIGDFNFDGMEDVAICDGDNGSYGGPSYRVYLSSRKAGKFLFDEAFTKLGYHLGMFTVDAKEKRLRIFDKSGCCWHVTEEYAVVRGRPVKVFREVEDATIPDEAKVKIVTRRLLNGKWKETVRYVERKD